MSEKNPERKRTARERLAAERAKQQAAEKRRRALIVGATALGVLGLTAAVGVIAANAGKDGGAASGPVAAPARTGGADGLAIPVGEDGAKATLTVWEDFRCPACKSFEDVYRPTIHELTDSGKLKVEYRLVTLIDGNMGGSGSRKAAGAAACAQDAGRFRDYHDVLYRNQPREADDAFARTSRLVELAGRVDGLDTESFRRCVRSGAREGWVAKSNAAFEKGDFPGTPTVLLGGTNISADRSMSPAKLKRMVEAANKA
ncbi:MULTISPECIES: DsbA family protein [Streptomyces]|uniref:DsbA family protein n=1 Tax=Streptomyces TaxID=1883 RepID=UPI00167110E2|nr:thioredoxin domain-containing protein [Streptomyces ruber]